MVVDRLDVKASARAPAHRLGRDRAGAVRRRRGAGLRRPAGRRPAPRAEVLRAPGLPVRRPVVRGARAAIVLVQLAVRRLPGLHRARHPDGGRPGAGRLRPGQDAGRWRDRPVERRSRQRLLHPADRGARRATIGFDIDTPWRRLPAAAQRALLHGYDKQVHVRYRNRYGQRARRTTPSFEGAIPYIERRHAEAESDSSRERFAGSCARCPARPARAPRLKPECARGDGGRPVHRRVLRDADRRAGQAAARPGAVRRGSSTIAEPGAQGDQRPARIPARRGAGLPDAGPARRRRWPAARRSGSGWPPRSAPGWSACSTCWTSRRSGCTSGTTTG